VPDESFAARADAVDRRIRELEPAAAAHVERKPGANDSVTWANGDAWATLALHDADRLELTLHTRSDEHPETLEIQMDDADVVDMIAEPVAALLAGKQQ
jgi:hypothetical protein